MFSSRYFVLGILIASLFVTAHFLIYGIPNNDDSLIHLTFASAVYDSLASGHVYVSGQPEINNGYGAFTVRFYPMLAAYSLAAFYFVTKSWHVAAFLFFWLWMSIGGLGVFLFAREWLENKYAFLASLLYVFEPYHNVQINALFADAEFVAGSVLVFCFLFTTRVLRYGKTQDVLALAISYSLLILSNIPVTLIGSIALAVYSLGCFCFFRIDLAKALKLSAGFVTGVAGSSFYLYRLFSELPWLNHSDPKFLNVGGENYEHYFVDNAVAFFSGDLVLFNFVILLLAPIAILLIRAGRETKRTVSPLIIVTLISIFMSTSYSGIVWRAFPPLQNVQFPWRWFTVTSIGFGVIIALSTSTLSSIVNGRKPVLALWMGVFLGASLFFTYAYVIKANLIDESFVIANGELENAVSANSHRPTFDAWQTIWARASAFSVNEKVIASGRSYEINRWEGFSKQVRVEPGEAQNVRLAVSYYPHWRARVNGVSVNVSKTEDGVVTVPVGSDESVIELDFVEPFWVKAFLAVSCVTWLAVLILLSRSLGGRLRKA